MILAVVVLLLVIISMLLLHFAHRAPVTALDDSLTVVDAALDAPVERRMAA